VEQAKKMNPRYLVMVIPSRWFSGGRGLDDFRDTMLHDKRIRHITDYFDPTDCFPGIDLSGGVCYFLWNRDNEGECAFNSILNTRTSTMNRPLLENDCDTLIRFNQGITIFRKVQNTTQQAFSELASSMKPFGLRTYYKGRKEQTKGSIRLFAYPENGYIQRDEIKQNMDLVDKYKIMIAGTYGERGTFPYMVIAKPFLAGPNTCCTETYLVFGPFQSENISLNVLTYM
jgi:site-specific DNA-methyltransferase (adenine-specific)